MEAAWALLFSAGASLVFAAAAFLYYKNHDKVQRWTLSLFPPLLRKHEEMKGGVADTINKIATVLFFVFLSTCFAFAFLGGLWAVLVG
jgi:hypothetical protein